MSSPLTASERTFTTIYLHDGWTGGSGSGSHPRNTSTYRRFLQRFLRAHRVASVVDLGCGDWQSSCLVDWTGIDYLGIDVVGPVVEANKRRHSAKNIRFERTDVLEDGLPAADLALVKDVLQHWPNSLITDLRPHLEQYRQVLITNTIAHAGPDGGGDDPGRVIGTSCWGSCVRST